MKRRTCHAYDNLANSAYLRAKEDYLMGINFSRVLTLRYGNSVSSYLKSKYQAIAVGRVMTCVLGMVVRREREIRCFRQDTILPGDLRNRTGRGEIRR